jgi:hypothetical protein
MFLTGLKFFLGYIVGGLLFTGMLALATGGAEIYLRRKRRRRLRTEKTRAQRCAMPRFREHAAFQFTYRSDDWLSASDKPEALR